MTNREYVHGLIGRAVERINEGVSKTLTARLQTETPPLDPRHLTDTRTRVSTLPEYALAYELNHLLIEEGEGRSASAVLWNVFPDLIIRDARRAPFIGLEVKALHTAAEEKSANLSTPLHVIKRGTDFVVIIIWAWRRETIDGVSITYPHIHAAELFDAYLLAQTRDYSWLFKKGKQRKGIDISTPLLTPKKRPNSDRFKAEENNIGKLMRIDLEPGLPETTPGLGAMKREAVGYQKFKTRALVLGLTETFREICDLQCATDVECRLLGEYPKTLTQIGHAKLSGQRRIYLFAGGNSKSAARQKLDSVAHPAGTIAFWLGSKLKWTVFKVVRGQLEASRQRHQTRYRLRENRSRNRKLDRPRLRRDLVPHLLKLRLPVGMVTRAADVQNHRYKFAETRDGEQLFARDVADAESLTCLFDVEHVAE